MRRVFTSPVVRFSHKQHKQQAHIKHHTHKDRMLPKTGYPLIFLELVEQLMHCVGFLRHAAELPRSMMQHLIHNH